MLDSPVRPRLRLNNVLIVLKYLLPPSLISMLIAFDGHAFPLLYYIKLSQAISIKKNLLKELKQLLVYVERSPSDTIFYCSHILLQLLYIFFEFKSISINLFTIIGNSFTQSSSFQFEHWVKAFGFVHFRKHYFRRQINHYRVTALQHKFYITFSNIILFLLLFFIATQSADQSKFNSFS